MSAACARGFACWDHSSPGGAGEWFRCRADAAWGTGPSTSTCEVWPRWGFFALIVLAVTGTALPLSWLINQRLLGRQTRVVTRQAIWLGMYVALLVWLKIGQALSFSVALWAVLVSLAIEYLFQLREGANRPKPEQE